MLTEEEVTKQKKERIDCLEKILDSSARKKIIVAGAGTGKTFTFEKILRKNTTGNNIVLTFIRLLTSDMNNSFGDLAEVKTFHSFCKKILHEKNGRVDIYPFLTEIIENDSKYLNKKLIAFDDKFQLLDEHSAEVAFYMNRGDYYEAVSFNDSVFRLFNLLRNDESALPTYNQILIDEFQDFNPLEVAFINELEKRGNILIVGDDDQAVYNTRNASSIHLIEKYNSNNYEKFELPFCSRCTDVIVEASKAFIRKAQEKGHLANRIDKRYESFYETKAADSSKYSKIVTVCCTLGSTVAKYIHSAINQIDETEIAESWVEGNEYPTVLIVGPKQYLDLVYKELVTDYPQLKYKQKTDDSFNSNSAYQILLKDENHNLGWRLLIDFYLDKEEIKRIITASENGKSIVDMLNPNFVEQQKKVLEIIKQIKSGKEITSESDSELTRIVKSSSEEIKNYFRPKDENCEDEIDKSKPSILLTSYVGCKGLSAGFTFIVGVNNGSMPKSETNITDVDISQFMVALTRTRKQCHIVSNKWLTSPVRKGHYTKPFGKSIFLNWIPSKYLENKGELKAKDIK